jgi:two-component system response regulator AtoC
LPPARPRSTKTISRDRSVSPADELGSGLLLVAGEDKLTTFPLSRDEVVIGRDPACEVVVPDATLSRRHARLRLGPPLTLEDLGSKNGTLLARAPLERGKPVPFRVGESFFIGRFCCVVLRTPRATGRSSRSGAGESLRVVDPTPERATALIRDIAKSGINTLIIGETGVGKEVLAETLHRLSERTGALVGINCAAIAPALIESELFGHEKGAFTGATHARPGLLEAAAGGTLFLDEVGELPGAAQAKLLRVIETREVLRVGAVRPVAVDVRFVAATNRDLSNEIASDRFRSDLYFRLDGITLEIPPLRERRQQIAPLALEFLRAAYSRRSGGPPLQLAADLMKRLEEYHWPGNVRELKAVIERAALLARGGEIGGHHLVLAAAPRGKRAADAGAGATLADPAVAAWSPREAEERQRLIEAIERCAGNQTRAAKLLGISRATLVHKLALYRIPRPRA